MLNQKQDSAVYMKNRIKKINSIKRLFFCFIALLFLCKLIPGCSNQENKKESNTPPTKKIPAHGGSYQIPLANNPITLDPAYVLGTYGGFVVHQIFDGLVRFDPYLSILPALAETWEVNNGKVYTFKLKQNAVFHNQDPVTAKDVRFTLKRLLRMEPPSAVLQHLLRIKGAVEYRNKTRDTLSGFKIETEKKFSIHLLTPHAPFLTALAMYQASIVPEKAVMRLGDAFGRHPVGSGPFRFVSWDDKKAIQLHRFNAYYGEAAYLDEILFRIYPGGQNQAILNDFKNNRLDEITVFGNDQEELSELKGLQWFHEPSMSLFFYGINICHPRLESSGLRKALSAAIDRHTLVNKVYDGKYQVTQTILPPGMTGHQRFDPVKKKHSVSSQNFLKPYIESSPLHQKKLEIEIVSLVKTSRVEKELELIQKFWTPLGIIVRPKYITDWKEFQSYLRSDAVQIYRYGWHADMPDPDSFLSSLFLSDAAHNFMNLKDEAIDTRLSHAREIIDPIKRAEVYQKIEAEILAATPIIPLVYMNENRVYQPHVRSARISALGPHTTKLNQIWLDPGLRK